MNQCWTCDHQFLSHGRLDRHAREVGHPAHDPIHALSAHRRGVA